MKVLVGYRYGIVGGVCTQLESRLRGMGNSCGIQFEFAFREFHGGERMLARWAPVHALEPDGFRTKAQAMDAVVVIDTAEYLDAVENIGRPVLLEVHTTTERGLAYLEGRRWLGHQILVPSEASADLVRRRFGIRSTIEVLFNVVDGERFQPGPAEGTVPERPILAWVGKLDAHKNWEMFLEVAATAAHSGLDAEAWLVGGYTAHEPVVRSLLESSAAMDLHPRLRWLPKVPYEGMPSFYRAVAATGGVAVSTTRNESFGMSLAEALLSGVPVVAPRVGALPELDLQGGGPDGEASYLALYPSGDTAAAVQATKRLIANEMERASADALLRLDRPRLAHAWSPARIGAQYADILRKLRLR